MLCPRVLSAFSSKFPRSEAVEEPTVEPPRIVVLQILLSITFVKRRPVLRLVGTYMLPGMNFPLNDGVGYSSITLIIRVPLSAMLTMQIRSPASGHGMGSFRWSGG